MLATALVMDPRHTLPSPNGSERPNTMASSASRMPPQRPYLPPPSFSPEVGSMTPLQVDEASAYTTTPEFSSETDLLPHPTNGSVFLQGGEYPMPSTQTQGDNNSKVRVLKTPRVRRRNKTEKSDKTANPIITEPLSVLTKHMNSIPLKDMKKWVMRDAQTRNQEARRKGRIARPMNSFMLYRSAYAERTKVWCRQNNHQVVSRVSGQSWPKEPASIREEYEQLALIERDNHQKAHPNYKFAPNKTQTPPKKKRNLADEDSEGEEESEVRGATQSSPMSVKRVKTSGLSSSYNSRDSTPVDSHESLLEPYNPSGWQLPSGRPMALPPVFPPAEHGYFMPTPHSMDGHNHTGPGLITGHYGTSTSLVGIPGGVHQELVRTYPGGHGISPLEDAQLDPQLLGSDTGTDMRYFGRSAFPAAYWQGESDINPYMSMTSHGIGYEGMNSYGGPGLGDHSNMWAGCDEGVSEVAKDLDWLQQGGYPS